jgi:hypothetical protein
MTMPTNAPAPEKAPESADIAAVLAQLEALRDNTLVFSKYATSGIAGKAFDLIESLQREVTQLRERGQELEETLHIIRSCAQHYKTESKTKLRMTLELIYAKARKALEREGDEPDWAEADRQYRDDLSRERND